MACTILVSIAAVLFFGWYLAVYNALIKAENAADQAWSDIEVELKRRFDLVENLVQVVKGYTVHERETFEEISKLRAEQGPAAASAAQKSLSKDIERLFALVEAYPALKADDQFLQLQKNLVDTEDRIAARRITYNEAVTAYHNRCQSFPQNIICQAHAFESRELFDAPDELAKTAPSVALQ